MKDDQIDGCSMDVGDGKNVNYLVEKLKQCVKLFFWTLSIF
jgi:hypothetical protein